MHHEQNHLASREKLPQLDALRGICAVMVALHHVEFQWPLRMTGLMRHGALFVDFFFVLSGFIIAYNYERIRTAPELGRFMWLRFARVYPLHLVMLLVFLGYETAQWWIIQHQQLQLQSPPFSDNDAAGFLMNLTLLNGVGLRPLSFNVPAWSISTEFWTYLMFGVIALACAGRPRLRRWTYLGVVVLSLVFLVAGREQPRLTEDYPYFLPRCVLGFFLGAVLFTFWRDRQPGPSRGLMPVMCQLFALALAVAIVIYAGPDRLELEFAAPFTFMLTIAVFARFPDTLLVRLLTRKPLIWMGTVSYSIYMVHMIVLFAIEAVLRFGLHAATTDLGIEIGPASGTALVVLYVACVLALASLTYRFVEAPARKLGRELLPAAAPERREVRLLGSGDEPSRLSVSGPRL